MNTTVLSHIFASINQCLKVKWTNLKLVVCLQLIEPVIYNLCVYAALYRINHWDC